jgi:hypothetical protein
VEGGVVERAKPVLLGLGGLGWRRRGTGPRPLRFRLCLLHGRVQRCLCDLAVHAATREGKGFVIDGRQGRRAGGSCGFPPDCVERAKGKAFFFPGFPVSDIGRFDELSSHFFFTFVGRTRIYSLGLSFQVTNYFLRKSQIIYVLNLDI